MEPHPSSKDFHASIDEWFGLRLLVAGGLRWFNEQDDDFSCDFAVADGSQCAGWENAAIYGYGDGHIEHGCDVERCGRNCQRKHY
jgi:hypothetical protein